MELKPIKQTKIHCAEKLYELLSNNKVVYRQVSDHETLLNFAQG